MNDITPFYNVPSHCGCVNSSKTKHTHCKNSVALVYQFQSGRLRYSCGIHGHTTSVITSIQTHDYINIYKKINGNNFTLIKKNVHCYLVYTYSRLFYGPFTHVQTLKVQVVETASKYKSEFDKFKDEFDDETHATMVNLSTELRSSFIGDDRTGENARIEQLQYVNLYLENYLNAKNKLMVFYDICEDVYNKLEIEKQIEASKRIVFKLVWSDISIHKECTICLSDVTHDNNCQGGHLECGHAFHNNCIKPWATMDKNTCPTCRTPVQFKKFITKMI